MPNKTDHVKLLKPLPKPIWKNQEIQPLRGVPRLNFDYPKLNYPKRKLIND